ncbi:MAG: M15 family metallopeptidase [Hyphomicrobiales bacterium]|nr:M15 family metallopeptidase [Hyphomicrobiales bacterium]
MDRRGSAAVRAAAAALIAAILPACSMALAADGGSTRGMWRPIPDSVWRTMLGKSWHPGFGCPARETLALLSVPYLDFHGRRQKGELIVARTVADGVLTAFAGMMRSGFRIRQMRLIDEFDGDDDRSMAANNTSGFNCRKVSGSNRLSEHAFGKAIDINPVQNPYVWRRGTSPPAGAAYDEPRERKQPQTGMIRQGDAVTRAFGRIGWTWGGTWRNSKDYQHFSRSGR